MFILYRAVSLAERADIEAVRCLRQGPNSCEGKHLFRSRQDAAIWGTRMYREEQFAIVTVQIPAASLDALHHFPRIDVVGEAYFATIDQLRDLIVIEVNDA